MTSKQRYLEVIVNVPLNQTFTYLEPEDSSEEGKGNPENPFGCRVEVRFGNRKLTGIVAAIHDGIPTNCPVDKTKIRTALRYIDKEPILTQELYNTALWMQKYYLSSIGETVFAMIPSGRRETDSSSFSFTEDDLSFEKKELSSEQTAAVEGILTQSESLFHYLYGTTGSGKTEVFLTVAERTLQKGMGVIYLVPEIGLTPQVVEAVVQRFGKVAAVLHSGLTPSQRLNEWKRILHEEARIVVGARSAIFAPVKKLGLIIIDEEHDGSYKSGSAPRYHARQVAMHRAAKLGIPLVMGSATPSVESWKAMEDKTIIRHTLTRRLAGGAMPSIRAVNLSLEPSQGGCLSRELEEEIRSALDQKRQTILFLNRRGFTHFFRCNSCGFEMKCKNCSVPLTYHKTENRLRCHYCGYSIQPPAQCPECGSLDVGYSGFGTEFIEAEVKSKFPSAKVMRIDTDSLTKKGELQEKLNLFKSGEYDILLGTQMIAKGLNFPRLKLAGVVLADTGLHMPDFRAAERTFALITQVAGRAGRFFPDGRVIVQSYSPDREPIALAVSAQTEEFYTRELQNREILCFPPYSRLLRFVFRSSVPEAAKTAANGAYHILKANIQSGVDILGPAECPLSMISLNYRHQIILRSKQIVPMQKMAEVLVYGYSAPKNVYIEVDVDPVNLM
ncbi:MAG: primosomal protein N' [Treponema sp.]|nr:primosomal protein N' [Treponema sp.]